MKKNQALVILKRNKAKTTSLIVAEKFGKQHFHVMRDIKNLHKKGCSLKFNQSNFGLVNYVDPKGEQRPYYEMTRDGFTMLVMGYTGKKAMRFKEEYISAFNRMEEWIITKRSMHADPEWHAIREDGKLCHRDLTDTIKEFIAYAEAQGSRNAEKYYLVFPKMVNSALFELPEGMAKPKNLRSVLDKSGLIQAVSADMIVDRALQAGMAEGLFYKEVYRSAKEKMEYLALANGGKTPVMLPQLQLFDRETPMIEERADEYAV